MSADVLEFSGKLLQILLKKIENAYHCEDVSIVVCIKQEIRAVARKSRHAACKANCGNFWLRMRRTATFLFPV